MPTPADIPISSLPSGSTVGSGNLLPVVQTGTTVKVQVGALATGIAVATPTSQGAMSADDKAKLDNATYLATSSTLVQRDTLGNFVTNTLTASRVTGLDTPASPSDAANKSYVDASVAGLLVHPAARVATVGANISLGAAPNTLDGISLALNDRILVKDQSTASQNGIYYVSSLGTGSNGVWQRTSDADTSAELDTGSYVFITSGTLNANTSWVMNTPGPIILGTTALNWVLYTSITSIPASAITGEIVGYQIGDAQLTTAKFAAGITPVEIVYALPTSGNFEGRQAFLTTDNKLYRYTGSAWTASVATVDLTGQITNSQIVDAAIDAAKIATSAVTVTKIADGSISTPKIVAGAVQAAQIDALAVTAGKIAANAVTASTISAGAVEAGKLAANAVTAGTIAANAVTAGTIAAAAVSATEIAAGAVTTEKIYAGAVNADRLAANSVTAGKILAGAVTADKISVSSLSAISADIGTITAGTLSASTSVNVGTSFQQVQISSAGLNIAGGRISAIGDGAAPWLRVYGGGSYSTHVLEMNGLNGSLPPLLTSSVSGVAKVSLSTGSLTLTDVPLQMSGTAQIKKVTNDNYTPALFDGVNALEFRWSTTLNTLYLRVNGSTVIAIGPP